jgi:hypothetical protein
MVAATASKGHQIFSAAVLGRLGEATPPKTEALQKFLIPRIEFHSHRSIVRSISLDLNEQRE